MGFIKQHRLSIINPFSIPQKNKPFFIYVQNCKEIIPNSSTISLDFGYFCSVLELIIIHLIESIQLS